MNINDKHSYSKVAMNMNRSITAKAQEINGHAMFFNMGRIFNAFFLCNSMNNDAILSNILSEWLAVLAKMPLSMDEKAIRIRLAIEILEGIK